MQDKMFVWTRSGHVPHSHTCPTSSARLGSTPRGARLNLDAEVKKDLSRYRGHCFLPFSNILYQLYTCTIAPYLYPESIPRERLSEAHMEDEGSTVMGKL